MSWSFAVPGGTFVAALLGVAFFALVLLAARRRPPGWLLGLRIATAALGWCFAVQPTTITEDEEVREGTLVVLADDSRSMGLREGEGPRGAWLNGLRERWSGYDNVVFRRFGTDVSAWDGALGFRDGDSAIHNALDAVRAEEGVGAVLLLSDGGETERVRELGEGPAVHVVPIGPDSIRDDAIVDVQSDPVGFLRQRSLVRVSVVRSGARGAIPVRLFEGERLLGERLVDVNEAGEGDAVFRFEPRRIGRAAFRVTLPIEVDDAVPQNNDRAFLMEIKRDRLRVLLVAGRPTWDVRFLRAFLEDDASIDLISFFILRTTSDLTVASPEEMALIPFPTDELFREHLGSFDLIVFQDFDYAPYDMAGYLPGIASYVERGGSFAMLGGDRSFGSGGYASTPLADVLPVRFDDVDRPARGARAGAFAPTIAEGADYHPLVRLEVDVAANLQRWRDLEPLLGSNRFRGVGPNAQVLLERGRDPVLVAQEVGEGRVLAFGADSSFRWAMATGGRTGDRSHYDRFYDRVIRWLARDPALDSAQVSTSRVRYGPGARVDVRFLARDGRYGPVASASLQLDENESRSVTLAADGSGRASLIAPDEPGVHTLTLRADEEPLAQESFVVEGGGQELADVRVRRDLLTRLAQQTGGTVYETGDVGAPDAIDSTRRRSRGVRAFAPFSTVYAAAVLLILLLTSWLLRRRFGEN
ncbi:MAG: glutamine amidotransferase [Myxococcota bacterium]